jgi:hypothetical protein
MLVENFTVSLGFELPPGRPRSLPQAAQKRSSMLFEHQRAVVFSRACARCACTLGQKALEQTANPVAQQW